MSNPRGRTPNVVPPGVKLVDLHLSEYAERDLKHFAKYMQLRSRGTKVDAPSRHIPGRSEELLAQRAIEIAKLEQEHRGFRDRFDRLLLLMGATRL